MEVDLASRILARLRRGWVRFTAYALLVATLTVPAAAEQINISEEKPAVVVDVPSSFVSKDVTRGVQAKTPDGEVMVWFETFGPDELDALITDHDNYWTREGVSLGDDTTRFEREFGGKSVIATDHKGATWNGKPTVIRYLSIDANLPSNKRVLMSLWASPDGDKAHDAEIMAMIGSLKISE